MPKTVITADGEEREIVEIPRAEYNEMVSIKALKGEWHEQGAGPSEECDCYPHYGGLVWSEVMAVPDELIDVARKHAVGVGELLRS